MSSARQNPGLLRGARCAFSAPLGSLKKPQRVRSVAGIGVNMPYERLDSHRTSTEAERRDRDRRELGAETTATPRQRRWLWLGLASAGLLVVVVAALVLTADSGTIPEARPFDRVDAADTTLVVHWTGPACETVNTDRTEVAESSDHVQVTLFVDVPLDGCVGDDVSHSVELPLDASAADKELVDGACLLPGYFRDSRCPDEPLELD